MKICNLFKFFEKDYLVERFPNLSCTILPILYPVIWAFLCATFGFLIILSRADFKATGTQNLFIIVVPLSVIIAGILTLAEYTDIGPFRTESKQKKLRVLNESIKGSKLDSNISDEILEKVFYSLVERPGDAFRATVKYSSLVIVVALLMEILASKSTQNLFIIFMGGLISFLLLSLFVTFFAQRFIFGTLEQCRALLSKRGLKVKEPYFQFNSLKMKFSFFLLIPILVVLVVLSFISTLTFEIIILSLLGLIMAIIVSRQLSASIYDAFLGIKKFAEDLSKEKRTFFSTGSLDFEIIALSGSLNKASTEVYVSRKKVEKSKKELENRLEELEKWYRSTITKELEMADIKREIKKLKNI